MKEQTEVTSPSDYESESIEVKRYKVLLDYIKARRGELYDHHGDKKRKVLPVS